MNPMSLIRLLVCLAVAWTVTAIGYNALKQTTAAAPALTFFVPRPSFLDATDFGNANRRQMGPPCLIDRRTGNRTPIELPRDLTWDLLSVSPWLDQDGKPEAIARWANLATSDAPEPFCGLGLLKLPEATVVGRIATDVLPTGRACFVPGRVGEILFPAGDGQLYRCTIRGNTPGDAAPSEGSPVAEVSEGSAAIRPLAWDCPVPTSGTLLLADPVWPSDPRLRHLIFVSSTSQQPGRGGRLFQPPKLWWLEIDERGETIRRAGLLDVQSRTTAQKTGINTMALRFPTAVVTKGGGLGLVYLSQRAGTAQIELWWARLHLDPKSGAPSVGPSENLTDARPCEFRLSAPVVAADGRSILAPSRSGALVRLTIPESG